MRAALNRALVVAILPVALVHIVVVSRVRPGLARKVAIRWVQRLARATGVRLAVMGRPPAPAGGLTVLVANHSSFLDIAALLVAQPDVTFVAGADLFRIPLLAGAMRALGTVPVDRRSGRGVRLELPPGQQVSSLAVFPEGGIAPAGTRRRFKRGAFALAIEKEADLVPVAIHGSASVMSPRGWLGIRPGRVTVEFLPALPTTGRDRHVLTAVAETAILGALGREDGGSGPDGSSGRCDRVLSVRAGARG